VRRPRPQLHRCPPPDLPLLVHQADGQEALAIDPNRISGLSVGAVQEVQLPGLLETTGQVTFDDRLVSMTALVDGLRLLPAALSTGIGAQTQRPFRDLYR
jgi:hypothetical protein